MRSFPALILVASFLYAATYLFIKVAVEEIAPATLVAARLLLAAPVFAMLLSAAVGPRRAARTVWLEWRTGVVLGAASLAVPITLIAYGERWVSSGIAAIGIAATPIFVQVLARRLRPSERATGLRLTGIWLGLVGVVVLTGAMPEPGWRQALGTAAIVLAAFSFALALLYAQSSLERMSTLTVATASSLYGGLMILPFGLAQLPDQVPSGKAMGALLGLTVVNSIASQLLGWHIVARFGSARNSLSTYLTPPMALLLGAAVLAESITGTALLALGLILLGVALGSGLLRLRPEARLTRSVAPRREPGCD